MTDTRIEAWLAERRRIHAAATEGPWEAYEGPCREPANILTPQHTPIPMINGCCDGDGYLDNPADVVSIVDAHNHLPTLVAVVGMVLDRHRPDALYQTADQCENDDEEHQDSRHWEAEDGTLLCEDLPAGITQCRTCRYDDGEPEDWPCAELRALEAVIGDE